LAGDESIDAQTSNAVCFMLSRAREDLTLAFLSQLHRRQASGD
jgi:hypothetical protein